MEIEQIILIIIFIILIGILLTAGYFTEEKVAIDVLHKQCFTNINKS